ncbi:MAG: sugar phosphate isomerase/epimerase [Lachnospiraceae bacterium]|nr:sugar phosphate isomerase/epimerase [Lachnospiraceae bacterium]
MRLGMNFELKASSAVKWAEDLVALGVRATSFPLDYHADFKTIDEYRQAAEDYDIVIAEVGAWSNPMSPVKKEADAAFERCVEQLKLADHIGAKCCANITGANGDIWDGAYLGNYDPDFYRRMVEKTREIIDKAAPSRTHYAIEPMPYMVPAGPDEYLKLIEDVGSPHMGVHLDMVNWMNSWERVLNQQQFMDEVFEKLHGRIESCHFKDFTLEQKLTFHVKEVPVGKGIFDIDYYVKKINEEDADLPLMIEHLPSKTSFLRSMKYINKRYAGTTGVAAAL